MISAYGDGNRPVISGASNNLHIRCANCRYIVVDGLEFASSTGNGNVYLQKPAGNITIRNCSIHHGRSNNILILESSNNIIENNDISYGSSEGIRIMKEVASQPVTGNIIRNNKIHKNMRYAVMPIGSPSSRLDASGTQIYGNEIYNNSTAVYLVYANRVEIFNNNMHDNGKDCQGVGDCPGEHYAFAVQSGSYNDFHDNIISNTYATGIGVYGEQTPTINQSDGNRLYRNVVYNTLQGPKWKRDINWQSWTGHSVGSNNLIYENIFFGDGMNFVLGDTNPNISGNAAYNNVFYGGSSGVYFEGSSTNAGWTFKNNIFAGNRDYAIFAGQRTQGLVLQNNIYYKPNGGSLVRFNGANYTTTSITSLDTRAITSDPKFVGTTRWYDFRLQPGSPAIDRGLNLGDGFQNAFDPDDTTWAPTIADQNSHGPSWEIGAFVYKPR